MITITQDNTTAIKSGNYVYPNGTVFTGFLNISEQSSNLLTASIDWYINDDMSTKILGLNLPYGLEIPITEDLAAQFNAALMINTQIAVAYVDANYANLDGKVTITGIPQ